MEDVVSMFGSMVFNDYVMQTMLPDDIYKALKKTMEQGKHLELDIANVVATCMKDWAVAKGATHFTHWFQPMTGVTAEKHDSFIVPSGGGRIIMEFSGKELVRGEPDASSFPSGGLRATFEARGYTAWDPTSYAFIKDGTLYIPTAFCSYSGESLDKKTPLLRSMQALDKQALRILRLFGNTETRRVLTTVGPEQEYFLIDKSAYDQRPDLKYCGRTLFGARPPKGQEMDDHYFGSIRPRVAAFMADLERELWKLGVLAKTKHNEAAPAQHELAPIFATVNISADHNQLTMQTMKKVANQHGLSCLLHEKPFAGVNGSGKHNNWSICTDGGTNLLEPGETPFENAQFLLFLTAVIKAVDDYQELLRVTVASAGNDHRLGAGEAPPAIISVFLGDELTEILEAVEKGAIYSGKAKRNMEIGVTVLPHFPKDTTDRNRTSPMAFTGNKFEFRMPGSAFSISGPNFVMNTAVAEVLRQFADRLESAEDFRKDLSELIKSTIKQHKRIIFNGNNYTPEWTREAERRGLANLPTTVDALPHYTDEKNLEVLERHGVLSRSETFSRAELLTENYCKTIHIEALTMIDMTKKYIIPSVIAYEKDVAEALAAKKGLNAKLPCTLEERLLEKLSRLGASLYEKLDALENSVIKTKDYPDVREAAVFYRNTVFADMAALRGVADELETLVARKYWAYPSYAEILYSV